MTVAAGILIIRRFASSLAVMLTKPRGTVLLFSMLPAVYYLFDYVATVYTDLLYSGSLPVFEFLPFVYCIAYLIFASIYFKEYEAKCEAEQQNRLMELKRAQTEKEIEAIRRTEYAVSILRHDMRHFLTNILGCIDRGESDKAKAYIREIIDTADKTAVRKYCENEIVNMILSSYQSKIEAAGIRLDCSVRIPRELSVSDADLTSILSNGLENAVHAVSELEPDRREVSVELRTKDDKLLLSVANPYADTVTFRDGLPVTDEPGHGLGTRSIRYITEKSGGQCRFSAENGRFVLQVIL